MALTSVTQKNLRDALLLSGCMDSNSSLRAMFVDARLAPWKSQVPEANSKGERVSYTIAGLVDKFDNSGDNILAVLVKVIAQREAGMLVTTLLELAQQVQYETTGKRVSEQGVVLAEQLGINNPIKQESKTMVNYNDFNGPALALMYIRQLIELRKEFGLTVPEEMLEEGKALRRQVEAAATTEKQTYASSLKQQLREVETAKEKRARLEKQLAELGADDTEI
jgi:hypothetical protein